MNEQLYKNIANSTAHRSSRDESAKIILDNPVLLVDLLQIAYAINDENHYKACWILELVVEEKIDWMSQHLVDFCEKLSHFSNESALRSIAKICQFAAVEHQRKTKSGSYFLNQKQQQQVAESCFDWLIGDHKVATKAYSARALFALGKNSDWIYPELHSILQNGFGNHSAAYKVVAREILKKLSILL
ncbi:MAG: hypothetical protein PSV16_10425 [Flavobacterium sp.]|nr:hypothetical protein [Flavobacterium sp.]